MGPECTGAVSPSGPPLARGRMRNRDHLASSIDATRRSRTRGQASTGRPLAVAHGCRSSRRTARARTRIGAARMADARRRPGADMHEWHAARSAVGARCERRPAVGTRGQVGTSTGVAARPAGRVGTIPSCAAPSPAPAREPPAAARRRARRGHRRPRGRARVARAVAAPGPVRRLAAGPRRRRGPGRGQGEGRRHPRGPADRRPGAPRREPRRRRDRRGHGRRRAGADAGRGRPRQRARRRHREQASPRPSRPRARADVPRRRQPAALRGGGGGRHPRARPAVAGPRREPGRARPRDRQRDDELHPDGDGARGPRLRATSSPRPRRAATRRPTRPPTSRGSTPSTSS